MSKLLQRENKHLQQQHCASVLQPSIAQCLIRPEHWTELNWHSRCNPQDVTQTQHVRDSDSAIVSALPIRTPWALCRQQIHLQMPRFVRPTHENPKTFSVQCYREADESQRNTDLLQLFNLFLTYNGVIYSQHLHSLLFFQTVLVHPDNDLWSWKRKSTKVLESAGKKYNTEVYNASGRKSKALLDVFPGGEV